MDTKNRHNAEHTSYPADKMLPKEFSAYKFKSKDRTRSSKTSSKIKKLMHKFHYTRSRRWNKKVIEDALHDL